MEPKQNDSKLEGKLTTLIILVSIVIVLNLISLGGYWFQYLTSAGDRSNQKTSVEQDDPFGMDVLPPDPSGRTTHLPVDPKEASTDTVAPPDKKLASMIDRASVILLARHVKRDGKVFPIVSEILKLGPGVSFYYNIGDVMGSPMEIESGTNYGEGQVMFCEGSPATVGPSLMIHHGRVPELGDIPIGMLRQMIKQTKVEQGVDDKAAKTPDSQPDDKEKSKPGSE